MSTDVDRLWRLNNLYSVTDKRGRKVPFRLNWAQEQLFADLHTMNIILKARQLGFTTFIQILMLDAALFTDNIRCATIAHTLNDAKVIFRDKVRFVYDTLPEAVRNARPIAKDSADELMFSNNSSIRVGVSMRGGTLQYLHVSEYGKLSARFPDRAREVRTGSLNALQAGNVAFIESTAEGQEGHFFELCEAAQSKQRMGTDLSPLDFKFHFFPWFKCPDYTLPAHAGAPIPDTYQRYFEKLAETQGIALSDGQKAWYCAKGETQLSDMKREYPSTAAEAFESSIEGAFYADQLAAAELHGRIGEFPADPQLPVHTSWDLGIGDSTSVWFWQIHAERRRLIGYLENSGEGMPWYITEMSRLARERGWTLGEHWLPHDSMAREWTTGRTRFEQFKEATQRFPKLVPQESIEDGINAAPLILARCEFDQAACFEGLKALRAYRREWDEEKGIWRDRPRHDWASHGADAFRYFALAIRDARPIVLPPPRVVPLPTFFFEAQPDGTIRSNMTINDIIERRTRSRLEREFG